MVVGAVPRRSPLFVDRVVQRQTMTELLTASRDADRTCLIYLHAHVGSGRFTLASQFFYENRVEFDHYIEVTARQADGQLMPPGEMLGQALRGLGVPDTELSDTDQARADDFRRMAAGRRFLMVVKDVASVDQVRLLIPTSAGAMVVFTTRGNLRELQHFDFTPIAVEMLPIDDARELMVEVLGDTAARISEAVREKLLELCDGYPLLIRVVAAQVRDRPHVAKRLIDDAMRAGASLLAVDPSKGIILSLEQACNALPEDQRPAYRTLSLLPGPDFSTDAAGVALSCGGDEAGRVLDALVDANLLQFDGDGERYSFHPVLRQDARSRALQVDGQSAIDAVISRIVDWYLAQAARNDASLADRWRIGPAFRTQSEAGRPIPDRAEALSWFAAEWRNVVACVRSAQEIQAHEVATQLCTSAFKYLHSRGYYDAWLDCHLVGLESAELVGDTEAIMQLASQRGAAYLALEQLDEARADFERSLDCALALNHREGEQSAREWLGKVAAKQGDTAEALRRFDESEAVIERSGELISPEQQARMRALLALHRARVFFAEGELASAGQCLLDALRYFGTQSREPDNRAKCLALLGQVRAAEGQATEAIELLEDAVRLFQADGLLRSEGHARRRIGEILEAAGDAAAARLAYLAALDLFARTGDAAAEPVRTRLESLDG